MKNKKTFNKGFSLVELIAVIVVLGLLASIVTPVVKNVISDNRNKLYQKQIDGIVESAKVWGANNVGKLPGDGEPNVEITLGDLKKGGYADKNLKNPKTERLFDDEATKIIISNQNGILNYTVVVE